MTEERSPEKESPLEKLRLKASLTQADLAARIPDKAGNKTLSARAISAWERGEYQPELTIPQVKALSKALGVTLDELPDDLRPTNI